MNKQTVVRLLLSLTLLTVPAMAGIVFDNFPINGTIDGWAINSDSSVSDSFTLGSNATLASADFGLFLTDDPGGATFIDYAIGTTPFDNSLGTGDPQAVLTLLSIPNSLMDVYDATFVFNSGTALNAGTYYLTLYGFSSFNGVDAYWDENDGSASTNAYATGFGHLVDSGSGCGDTGIGTGTCSESFEISGTTQPVGGVPEPSTLVLLGSGILAAFALRRKTIYR